MFTHKKTQSGYSLVEAIIYVALFASLSVLLIDCFLVMSKAYNETRADRDILDSAQVTIERISREIRTAKSIGMGTSVFGTDPGTLLLNTTDASGSARVEEFYVASGAVVFVDNGASPDYLTGQQVQVTSLIFRNIPTINGHAIRVEMTFKSLRSKLDKTVSFSDTINMRGSY